MLKIEIPRSQPLSAHLRMLVEQGVPDGPAEVHYDGKHCLSIGSIHQAACLVPTNGTWTHWTPGAGEKVGPRMAALLAKTRAEVEARKAARSKGRRAKS